MPEALDSFCALVGLEGEGRRIALEHLGVHTFEDLMRRYLSDKDTLKRDLLEAPMSLSKAQLSKVFALLRASTLSSEYMRTLEGNDACASQSDKDEATPQKLWSSTPSLWWRVSMFDLVDEMCTVLDENFTVVDCNAAFRSFFGPGELSVGQHCHPDDAERTKRAMLASERHVNRARNQFGEYRYCEWVVTFLNGVYFAIGHDVTDRMEQQKRQEQFLRNLLHELRNPLQGVMGAVELARVSPEMSAHATNEMLARAEGGIDRATAPDAARALDELADTLKEYRKVLSNVAAAASQLDCVINGTMTMAHVSHDEMQFTDTPFLVDEAAMRALAVMSAAGRARGLDLHLKPHQKPLVHPWRDGDIRWISQVLINLLGNSIKFTPNGGSVAISCEEVDARENNLVVYTVSDTGLGMDASKIAHLVQPFSQEARVEGAVLEAQMQGNGLGLSIVHSIVSRMGGKVEVTSEPGNGCTVSVMLPLKVSDKCACEKESSRASTASEPSQAPPQSPSEHQSGSGVAFEAGLHVAAEETQDTQSNERMSCTHALPRRKNGAMQHVAQHLTGEQISTSAENRFASACCDSFPLLHQHSTPARPLHVAVVDDSDLIRRLSIRLLERVGHVPMTQCGGDALTDGVKCLEWLRACDRLPDTILVDMQMPRMNGLELVGRIRSDPVLCNIVLVIVTANSLEEDKKAAALAGVDAFLVKPYRAEMLVETIEEAMRTRNPSNTRL
eukprot:TRINITY_DN12560_c0_g1_i1.p1 TRINITY_DN12560_c0_g1~~TRINITY_DN12560_c0_g1_i1.p1  ORF type:complete len:754 (+),score=197.42 TRINITY_DN12560_c0_g1_i1:75-2264(+)